MRHWIMTACLAAGLVLCGGNLANAQATAHDYLDQSCNANGYVLTPKGTVAGKRLTGPLATARTYLGKSCDAFNASLGQGEWCWANAGVILRFRGEEFGLYRMELYCEHPGLSKGASDCSCGNRL